MLTRTPQTNYRADALYQRVVSIPGSGGNEDDEEWVMVQPHYVSPVAAG